MWSLLPRGTQITIIVLIAVYSGWLVSEASTLISGHAESPAKSASLVASIISIAIIGLFSAVWRKVWNLVPWLSRWFPDLTGKWEGTYVSTFERPDGQKASGTFTAAIRQGLFTTTVTAWTDEMRSSSTRSWLDADRDAQRFKIGYTYRSETNAAVRDRSTPHDGVCFLTLHPDSEVDCFRGTYHTDRRTIGDIVLHRISRDPAGAGTAG